ncbi:hypothetical protein VCRA2120O332_20276 [Vibrio crassostreae]|nr:hypothetical protein VCRA2114E327_30274 [Vibrio crassostreae]CAK3483057.1 hypothetical protein VCRA2120O332_20276 [Vibrio crassostreae]
MCFNTPICYWVNLNGKKKQWNHMALNGRTMVAKRIAIRMYLFWIFISIA